MMTGLHDILHSHEIVISHHRTGLLRHTRGPQIALSQSLSGNRRLRNVMMHFIARMQSLIHEQHVPEV